MVRKGLPQDRKNNRSSWRAYGYLAAVLLLGVAVGLLLYPLLTYPEIWRWVFLGGSILLLILTAPFLQR